MKRIPKKPPATVSPQVKTVDRTDKLVALLSSMIQPGTGRNAWLSLDEATRLLAVAAKSSPGGRTKLIEVLASGIRHGYIGDQPLILGKTTLDLISKFARVNPEIYPRPSLNLEIANAPWPRRESTHSIPVPLSKDFAATPLGVRLGLKNTNITKATVASLLSDRLGVDIGESFENMDISILDSAELSLRILLRDAMDYRLPLKGGGTLDIAIPRSPTGTALKLSVRIANEGNEPSLSNLHMNFESWGLGGISKTLEDSAVPRVENPAVLSPGGAMRDFLLNASIDLLIRGMTIDDNGKISIDGEARILGGLQTRGLDSFTDELPKLNVALSELAAGNVFAGVDDAPVPEFNMDLPIDTREWLRALSTIALGGTWELEASAGEVDLSFDGDLGVGDKFRLIGKTEAKLSVGDSSIEFGVLGENRAETSNGNLEMSFRHSANSDPLHTKVSWDSGGLILSELDIESMLPLKLAPRPALGDAPRLGSAAFKNRIDALLDDAAPLTQGNKISFYQSGTEVLEGRLATIRKATAGQTLLMQTFIFHDDICGGEIIDELIAAKKRGVDVRVLIDAVGSMEDEMDLMTGNPAYNRLKAGGVDVALTNDPKDSALGQFEELREMLGAKDLAKDLLHAGAPGLSAIVDSLKPQSGGFEKSFTEADTLIELIPSLVLALEELTNKPQLSQLVSSQTIAAFDKLYSGRSAPELVREIVRSLGRDHRKRLVLFGKNSDGHVDAEMLMGGNNTADDYLLSRDDQRFNALPEPKSKHVLWADADVKIEGTEAVALEVKEFAEYWKTTGTGTPPPVFSDLPRDEPSKKGIPLRIVHHRPVAAVGEADGDNHFANVLIATLDGMGRGDTMRIENPYFIPITQIQDAMVEAAMRGARIRVLTNGPNEKNDAESIALHSRAFCLSRLVATPGIEVFERNKNSDPVHQKSVLTTNSAGQVIYMLGSQNLDSLSARINKEMFLVGGTALGSSGSEEVIERGLFRDFRNDTAEKYAKKVRLADVTTHSFEETLDNYLRSLLAPAM